MAKLVLRKSCYSLIDSKIGTIENTEEHKQLSKEANEIIKKGQLKYVKAYECAKDYYK